MGKPNPQLIEGVRYCMVLAGHIFAGNYFSLVYFLVPELDINQIPALHPGNKETEAITQGKGYWRSGDW